MAEIHKSTLFAPFTPGGETIVSFLNHFLIKRSIKSVLMLIYPVSEVFDSNPRVVSLDQPKSYLFNLSRLYPSEAKGFHIEFISPENISIPFPAVLIYQRFHDKINVVHAYSRINSLIHSSMSEFTTEASIESYYLDDYRPFIDFTVGPDATGETLSIDVVAPSLETVASVEISPTPLSTTRIYLDACLRQLGVQYSDFAVTFPSQQRFYTRLLCGHENIHDHSIIANHSYYPRVTQANTSNHYTLTKYYPYTSRYRARISFPSLSTYEGISVQVDYYSSGNLLISLSRVFTLLTDISTSVDICGDDSMSDGSVFSLTFRSTNGQPLPTRIAHQLSFSNTPYSDNCHQVRCSIQETVLLPEYYLSSGKYICWFSLYFNSLYSAACSLSLSYLPAAADLHVSVYNESGLLGSFHVSIEPRTSIEIDATQVSSLIGREVKTGHVWFYVTSSSPGIYGYIINSHTLSPHLTAEHVF